MAIAELPNEANKFFVFSDFEFSMMKRAPPERRRTGTASILTILWHRLAVLRSGVNHSVIALIRCLSPVATLSIGEEFHWSDERFSANLAPKGEWEWTTAG
jgi:hypothetical protein